MPLQVWVQSVAAGLRIVEFPVPRVYLDEKRSFGGSLDDAAIRLAHYRDVLDRALATHPVPSLTCAVTAAD
jgi:dolichol-phosphate mannosyltransferase